MPFLSRPFQTQPETHTSQAEERAQALRDEALNLLARVLISTPRPSADVAEEALSILDRLGAEEAKAVAGKRTPRGSAVPSAQCRREVPR